MLRSVSASSSCAPLWRARTTAARSATHVAPQTRSEHARRRPELDHAEVGLADVRDDGVEHESLHAIGMGERVPLADVRAVRDAVERPAVDAERAAQRLHVGDDVVRAEELPPCSQLPGARADGGRRRRPEIGAAHLGLQRGTVERPGAGASLVVDDDPVVVQLGAEDLRDARQRRHAGLARAAGDQEQHAARRAHVVGGRDGEPQRPSLPPRVVERHGERRARVAGERGARRRTGQ